MQTPSQHARGSDGEAAVLGEFANGNLDDIIPRLARDRAAMQHIESVSRSLPTTHDLILGDARTASALPSSRSTSSSLRRSTGL